MTNTEIELSEGSGSPTTEVLVQPVAWTGLTDEDVLEALTFIDKEAKRVPFMLMRFAVAIQAKLKELNT